ncbi:MAG: hypothetical protein JKY84_12480, partial [Emcibacteraceae bacterium]|nr:hypothetical protein [Emcibacteraceae bacterium]
MLKKTLLILTLLISPAYSDETADKAEFKHLYAEFNKLYANSGDIEPLIKMGEKLYKLAPNVYGENSQNMAVVTYNLASLYDKKGGETASDEEKKALRLYKKYFYLLEQLDAAKNKNYITQYSNYVQTHFNVNNLKSDNNFSNQFLEVAQNIDLSSIEYANLEYMVAIKRTTNGKTKDVEKLLNNVYNQFLKEYGEKDIKVGNVLYWLAQNNVKNKNPEQAISNYNKFIDIYSSIEDPDKITLLKNARLRLYEIFFLLRNHQKKVEQFAEFAKLHSLERGKTYNKGDPNEYAPIIRQVPKYPYNALQSQIEGFVILSLTVKADGTTKNINALFS